MIARTRDAETISKRCTLIESLGFTCEHGDSMVTFRDWDIIFDLSTLDLSPEFAVRNIMITVIGVTHRMGYLAGEKNIQSGMINLLGLGDKDD